MGFKCFNLRVSPGVGGRQGGLALEENGAAAVRSRNIYVCLTLNWIKLGYYDFTSFSFRCKTQSPFAKNGLFVCKGILLTGARSGRDEDALDGLCWFASGADLPQNGDHYGKFTPKCQYLNYSHISK